MGISAAARDADGMKPQHSQIQDQLRAAFPRDPIVAAGAFASWGATYLDAVPYAEQLDGKPWDELDRDYLAVRADALGFLSTRQLAAVLPAYLMLMLERPTSDVPGMLMLILPKPDKQRKGLGLGKRRFTQLVEALTPTQRTAIASALRQFAAEHPEDDSARIPLESFWDRYLPGDE
jgi:hypothetical protein